MSKKRKVRHWNLPQPLRRWVHRATIWLNHRRIHLTPHDHRTIASADAPTLVRWSNDLNGWRWPVELLPDEGMRYVPGGRRSQLMDVIESIVGEKAINRAHNKDMTDEDHEDFWQTAYRRGDMGAYTAWQERCKMRERLRQLEQWAEQHQTRP